MPIATLNGPGLGKVDGTAMMNAEDEGFVFLFNPNLRIHNATLSVDESMGISNASMSSKYTVTELYPREGAAVGTWSHGDLLSVNIAGGDIYLQKEFPEKDFPEKCGVGMSPVASTTRGAHISQSSPQAAQSSCPAHAAQVR